MLTSSDTDLYNEDGEVVGKVSENMYLVLEEIEDTNTSEYFKIKNYDLYVKYTDIVKTEKQDIEDTRYS